jgi:hypothetical protein
MWYKNCTTGAGKKGKETGQLLEIKFKSLVIVCQFIFLRLIRTLFLKFNQ